MPLPEQVRVAEHSAEEVAALRGELAASDRKNADLRAELVALSTRLHEYQDARNIVEQRTRSVHSAENNIDKVRHRPPAACRIVRCLAVANVSLPPIPQAEPHFTILRLPLTASTSDVVSAFKRSARLIHPDKNTRADTTAAFQDLNTAKEELIKVIAALEQARSDLERARVALQGASKKLEDIGGFVVA